MWVTFTTVWVLGSVCYSSLTLKPPFYFLNTSHTGKRLRNLVKTENKTDKIHHLELTQEVCFAGAVGGFI